MNNNEVLMSIDGLKKMEEDLEYLKTVRRKISPQATMISMPKRYRLNTTSP